ncbi:MAG TPA: ECF-type sigma factor [Chthoniobacterales bacterium]|nr:ECF-type sigma factor [Chthoniobacterales bacterium]
MISDAAALLADLTLPSDESEAATLTTMIPAAYEELRRLAAGYLRGERSDHTLQPTALVHEVYLRLLDQSSIHWRNRAHFLGIAARMMRRILINHATAHRAEKRGGADAIRLQFDEALDFYQQRDVSLVAVDAALHRLEELDKRQAQIVEFRFFGGLTVEEIAKVLEIAPITVKREWATAKLWLQRELSEFRPNHLTNG